MPKFRILKPVAFTVGQGETAVVKHYRIPGEVVEISQRESESLVAEGRVEPVSDDSRPAAEDADKSDDADKPRPARRG